MQVHSSLCEPKTSLQCSEIGIAGIRFSKQMWEPFMIHYYREVWVPKRDASE